MKKGLHTKEKLFRVLFFLFDATDSEHGVSVAEVIEHLATFGIHAERKSIYDDFETLGALGFPVGQLGTRPQRYYLQERVFEPAELKLLTDAIVACNFITKERSRALIAKLSRFAGERQAAQLSRAVYVERRAKTENVAVMATIDGLHRALRENRQVSYRYFDYSCKKEKQYHRGGARYTLSPYALVWREENYYLIAYDAQADMLKHFRVDKIEALEVLAAPVIRPPRYERFDPADYAGKVFAMYGGTEELVTLWCASRLAGVIIDRFGTEPTFFPSGDGFRVAQRVALSPNFYAWVMSFGADMEILSPTYVREQMRTHLRRAVLLYESEEDMSQPKGDRHT